MSTSGGGSVVGLMAAVPEAGSGAQPPRAVLCREGATLHLPRSGEGSHLWRGRPQQLLQRDFYRESHLGLPTSGVLGVLISAGPRGGVTEDVITKT